MGLKLKCDTLLHIFFSVNKKKKNHAAIIFSTVTLRCKRKMETLGRLDQQQKKIFSSLTAFFIVYKIRPFDNIFY